jgi:catechol 2,3-dioxygenase-like lactoylglutathione lyase family enzyme
VIFSPLHRNGDDVGEADIRAAQRSGVGLPGASQRARISREVAVIDPASVNEQLVLELYTRNISASVEFYQQFGFRLLTTQPHFVELGWGRAQIYLEEVADAPAPDGPLVGNIRVLVPDVDRYWALAQELGCTVVKPIEDRYYGLRDFTIAGPDGVGLRFASRL